MDDSMAQAHSSPFPPGGLIREQAGWKSLASLVCAVFLGVLFIVAGAWKLTDPLGWAARVAQFQVPPVLSIPATLGIGIAETLAGAMLFVPRFRRWGAWITGVLLVLFMVHIGIHYQKLVGEECSCFPFVKRAVGPQFFIGDLLMLLAAAIAGKWASASHGLKSAALMLGALTVFAGVSFGVASFRQQGIEAPASVTVNGQPYSLRQGRVLLFFFDPECRHCFEAAQRFSQAQWKNVRIVAVPTRLPEFAGQFLSDTRLKADVTSDVAALRTKFTFNDPPYAVALENGRQRRAFFQFDEAEPATGLRSVGFID